MLSSTSLANHRFKLLGLILSALGILLFILLKILDYSYEEGWEDRIFMINHFVIVFGMIMIMYSSESSFYVILYLIEAVLAGYLLSFRISLRTNPSWIFLTPKAIRGRFILMGASILFLILWIIFVVINYKT